MVVETTRAVWGSIPGATAADVAAARMAVTARREQAVGLARERLKERAYGAGLAEATSKFRPGGARFEELDPWTAEAASRAWALGPEAEEVVESGATDWEKLVLKAEPATFGPERVRISPEEAAQRVGQEIRGYKQRAAVQESYRQQEATWTQAVAAKTAEEAWTAPGGGYEQYLASGLGYKEFLAQWLPGRPRAPPSYPTAEEAAPPPPIPVSMPRIEYGPKTFVSTTAQPGVFARYELGTDGAYVFRETTTAPPSGETVFKPTAQPGVFAEYTRGGVFLRAVGPGMAGGPVTAEPEALPGAALFPALTPTVEAVLQRPTVQAASVHDILLRGVKPTVPQPTVLGLAAPMPSPPQEAGIPWWNIPALVMGAVYSAGQATGGVLGTRGLIPLTPEEEKTAKAGFPLGVAIGKVQKPVVEAVYGAGQVAGDILGLRGTLPGAEETKRILAAGGPAAIWGVIPRVGVEKAYEAGRGIETPLRGTLPGAERVMKEFLAPTAELAGGLAFYAGVPAPSVLAVKTKAPSGVISKGVVAGPPGVPAAAKPSLAKTMDLTDLIPAKVVDVTGLRTRAPLRPGVATVETLLMPTRQQSLAARIITGVKEAPTVQRMVGVVQKPPIVPGPALVGGVPLRLAIIKPSLLIARGAPRGPYPPTLLGRGITQARVAMGEVKIATKEAVRRAAARARGGVGRALLAGTRLSPAEARMVLRGRVTTPAVKEARFLRRTVLAAREGAPKLPPAKPIDVTALTPRPLIGKPTRRLSKKTIAGLRFEAQTEARAQMVAARTREILKVEMETPKMAEARVAAEEARRELGWIRSQALREVSTKRAEEAAALAVKERETEAKLIEDIVQRKIAELQRAREVSLRRELRKYTPEKEAGLYGKAAYEPAKIQPPRPGEPGFIGPLITRPTIDLTKAGAIPTREVVEGLPLSSAISAPIPAARRPPVVWKPPTAELGAGERGGSTGQILLEKPRPAELEKPTPTVKEKKKIRGVGALFWLPPPAAVGVFREPIPGLGVVPITPSRERQEPTPRYGIIETPIQKQIPRYGTLQAPIQKQIPRYGTLQTPTQKQIPRYGTLQIPFQRQIPKQIQRYGTLLRQIQRPPPRPPRLVFPPPRKPPTIPPRRRAPSPRELGARWVNPLQAPGEVLKILPTGIAKLKKGKPIGQTLQTFGPSMLPGQYTGVYSRKARRKK